MFENDQFYKEILKYALLEKGCGYFSLTIRPEMIFNKEGCPFLKAVERLKIEDYQAVCWPGTKLFEEEANILVFSLNKESLELITLHSKNFSSWNQPSLPEDLCLYLELEKPWLASSYSEKIIWIDDSSKDVREKFKGKVEFSPLAKRW